MRRQSAARLLALLLAGGVGVVGAWLGLAVAGRSNVTAGPFEVRAGVQFGSGLTEVALPPLGHLTAATHTAPLRLSFSLQDVRTGQLSDILRDGGVDEVVTSVQKGLAARLVGLALRALGVALAGATALAVLELGIVTSMLRISTRRGWVTRSSSPWSSAGRTWHVGE